MRKKHNEGQNKVRDEFYLSPPMHLRWNPVGLADPLGLACSPRILIRQLSVRAESELSQMLSDCHWPQVFDFAGCQSPVFLLLRPASQLEVERVGQEGQHCEGGETLADNLNDGVQAKLWGTAEQQETHRQTGANLRQFVLQQFLSILVQSSFYYDSHSLTRTGTETKIGGALLRESVVTVLICPRNPRLDSLQMFFVSCQAVKTK